MMRKVFALGLVLLAFQSQQLVKAQTTSVLDSFKQATDSFISELSGSSKQIKVRSKKARQRYSITCLKDGTVYRIRRKIRYRKGVKLETVKITRVLSTATIVNEVKVHLVDGEYFYIRKYTYANFPSWEKLVEETATADTYNRKYFKSGKRGIHFWQFRKR